MDPLARVTARVHRHGDPNDPSTPRPLLTLEEFFDGNDAVGSIGCNIPSIPVPADFYRELKSIAARPNVFDVRVQITAFDMPEWPFSDAVWVITSASPDDVSSWFSRELSPDDCSIGWPDDCPMEDCEVPPGMHAVWCWWD